MVRQQKEDANKYMCTLVCMHTNEPWIVHRYPTPITVPSARPPARSALITLHQSPSNLCCSNHLLPPSVTYSDQSILFIQTWWKVHWKLWTYVVNKTSVRSKKTGVSAGTMHPSYISWQCESMHSKLWGNLPQSRYSESVASTCVVTASIVEIQG